MDALAGWATLRRAAPSARWGQFRQVVTFGSIGVVSTLAYIVLYSGLRFVAVPTVANALALLTTAVANTAANRRFTFEVSGRRDIARDHAAGLAALGVALALTSVSLAVLDLVAPHRGAAIELAVLVAANAAATLVRFLLLRVAIQDSRRFQERAATSLATLTTSERILR
jgi:putative flippase GtrA